MKLSIGSTAFDKLNPEDDRRLAPIEALHFLSSVGFEAVDMNLHVSIGPNSYLKMDDWKQTIENIKRTAEDCHIEISQSHLPFYNFATPGCEDLEFRAEMFDRSIEASAMLGVKWAVFHTGNAPDAVLSVKESKRRTLEYILPYFERTTKLGVGIAIENLFIPAYLHNTHRYCSNVEDVIDLVDTLGEGAGVCWDFGHANLNGDDQCDCLRAVGKRLKVIHVHDNSSTYDDHAAPYMGKSTVKWDEVLPALHEIGYEGNFNFEVGAAKVPREMHRFFAEYLIQTGKHMISQIK